MAANGNRPPEYRLAMARSELAAKQPRILVVEDDEDIARLILLHLEDIDAQVEHIVRGDAVQAKLTEEAWDLLLLDLRLPGLSGLDVCRELRAQGNRIPILMLTAKSGELDRVLGLELGADDYLTKPFSPLELVARVRALLRRAALVAADDDPSPERYLERGPIRICTESRTVTVRDRPVELTAREFDLLLYFARQPGRVFRRYELLDEVWGYGHDGYEHTVNSHINRLRRKIEDDPSKPRHVVTVWGVGYRFQVGP